MAIAIKGIDVSTWQNKNAISKVVNHVNARIKNESDGILQIKFVIIRAGHGLKTDDMLLTHYKEAKKLGLKVGFYWYSEATNNKSALREAQKCIEVISNYSLDVEMGIWCDVEDTNNLRTFVYNIGAVFCSYIANYGYYTGIYSSESWINSYNLARYTFPVWMAAYRGNNGDLIDLTRRGKCAILQYASRYYNTSNIRVGQDFNIAYYDLSNYVNKSERSFLVTFSPGMNVRELPGTEFTICGEIKKGTIVTGYKYNHWLKINKGTYKNKWVCIDDKINGVYMKNV